MHYADLEPRTAALLDTATDDAFFAVLGELLDDGLDPHVVLERRAPTFVLLVFGLARGSDEIVVEHEVPINWGNITEPVKFGVLELWVSTILANNATWTKKMNRKLVAQGLSAIKLPE